MAAEAEARLAIEQEKTKQQKLEAAERKAAEEADLFPVDERYRSMLNVLLTTLQQGMFNR